MNFDVGVLIGLRDGPNLSQGYDGVRVNWRAGAVQLNGFAVRPVGLRVTTTQRIKN